MSRGIKHIRFEALFTESTRQFDAIVPRTTNGFCAPRKSCKPCAAQRIVAHNLPHIQDALKPACDSAADSPTTKKCMSGIKNFSSHVPVTCLGKPLSKSISPDWAACTSRATASSVKRTSASRNSKPIASGRQRHLPTCPLLAVPPHRQLAAFEDLQPRIAGRKLPHKFPRCDRWNYRP